MPGYGLRPIDSTEGRVTGVTWYRVPDAYVTPWFTGDFADILATGVAARPGDATGESPTPSLWVAGVVGGFRYVDPSGQFQNTQYLPPSHRDAWVAVYTDPTQLYKIQATAAVTFAAIGINSAVSLFATTDASTVSGNSGISLQVSSFATTNTLGLRVVNIIRNGENENSSTPDVIVRINPGCFQQNLPLGI